MMALTTIFGGVQLAVQKSLGAGLTVTSGIPYVDNLIVVSMRPERVAAEFVGGVESFRRELHSALTEFVAANRWSVGGTGAIVVNILLRTIPEEFIVRTLTVNSLFDLVISDAHGQRTLPIRRQNVVVGRDHQGAPSGFVPLHDSRKIVSRRHLELTYRDSILTALSVGRNPTSLNGSPLESVPVALRVGDTLSCSDCRISVAAIA